MKKLILILPITLVLLFVSGCKKNNISDLETNGYTICTSEQKNATACNYMYAPVCGDDGETYGNSCVACSSQKINSYKDGECGCDAENGICSVEDVDIEKLEKAYDVVIQVPMPDF